ncbi:hypothetical protein [Metabacillus schmidteae]|uniref:hypothetical protein n=1 Tax=Metabacillus schmidteae TaxID=2730405 RepID=UPI00158C380B|nr:hypothetical protein [Metabacillus schmidteae]
MANERGNTLITVLLVSLIFTILGLAIVSATINSNQRTGVRVDDIELTAEATKNLNEAIAIFNTEILKDEDEGGKILLSEQNLNIGELDSNLGDISTDISESYSKNKNHSLTITDITEDEKFGNIDKTKQLTRIFKFSYTIKNEDGANITKTVSRNIYLSPTPSFLNYAIGSGPDGIVDINGAAEIRGDIFGGIINTEDTAYFIDDDSKNNEENISKGKTLYPQLGSNSEDDRFLANVSFKKNINEVEDIPTILQDLDQYFYKNSYMTITKDTSEFIDVNFENTLAQIFNDLSGSKQFDGVNFGSTELAAHAVQTLMSNNADIEQIAFCDQNVTVSPKAYVYTSNVIQGDTCTNQLESSWFIVNGDLQIPRDTEIPGNIIVTGNLIIEGNNYEGNNISKDEDTEDDDVFFDSTIYVVGTTRISHTNIKSLDNPKAKLILMSKGNLFINRINEFNSIKNVEPLDAFFYTDSDAELYGVGSLFRINGGLFAKKQLTINAIRQDSIERNAENKLGNEIDPVRRQETQASRFYVEYDKSVLLDPDRLSSLPRVDKYQILLDQQIVQDGEGKTD